MNFLSMSIFCVILRREINMNSKMDVPKDEANSQFTFTYDDIKGTVHVVDKLTGEEFDLLKEDTGWFDAEFKFDV